MGQIPCRALKDDAPRRRSTPRAIETEGNDIPPSGSQSVALSAHARIVGDSRLGQDTNSIATFHRQFTLATIRID
jgi:hypothetical protein